MAYCGVQETLSVNEVRKICELSEHLSSEDISYNDKTISWDGNIIYYSGNKGVKLGKEYTIPVQIKGKKVKKFSDRASYRIKNEDLNNYFNNRGVIFFLAEIIEDGTTKLYAKLLLQVDIILLRSHNKNKKTIAVDLDYIGSWIELERMCNVYIANISKQSMLIYNPSISNNYPDIFESTDSTISINVSLSADGRDYSPEIAMLRSKFAYFYISKNGINIPLIMEPGKIAIKKEELVHFKIPNVYEDELMVERIYSKNKLILVIQKIIKVEYCGQECNLSINAKEANNYEFSIMYKASRFIINFVTYNGMLMNNKIILADHINYEEFRQHFNKPEFIEFHKFILHLGEILDKYNVSMEFFLTTELLKDAKRLIDLDNLLSHRCYVTIGDRSKNEQIGKFTVAKKVMFIRAIKNSDGNYEAKQLFDKPWKLLVSDDGNIKDEKSCYWLLIEPDILADCLIDRQRMITELFEKEHLCEDPLFGRLGEYVLFLIHNYDSSKRKFNIQFADRLIEIIIHHAGVSNSEIINNLQIKKRISLLDESDKEKLIVLKNSNDSMAACCACILLEQWEEYRNIFLNLDIESQKSFCSWPIYNLVPAEYKS